MTKVRVRMAPSPTGPIHVGNMHTALFNWLFARSLGGTFILRFEDTDQERSKPEWEQVIYDEMRWLGLDWDEGPDLGGPSGPYRQMERLSLYREYADRLLASGHAYHCYCTPDELDAGRREAHQKGQMYVYSRHCLHLSEADKRRLEAEGRRPVLRFRVPDDTVVSFTDMLRGPIETPSHSISDFIVVRSSGIPVYNFAVVVDDITMDITHIIRGEGHISNTPVQALLYEALGQPMPQIAHVGHVLGSDRAKLSKRTGDAFIGEYRDQGYLAEALLNFLVLLGWAPAGDREFLTRDEMIKEFDLSRVTKTGAVFDLQKLEWMNAHYIRQQSVARLTDLCLPFLMQAGHLAEPPVGNERARVETIVGLEQERIRTLRDIADATAFFFHDPPAYDAAAVAKVLQPETMPMLAALREQLAAVSPWNVAGIEAACRAYVSASGLKVKQVFQPVRVAVTGRTVSPPLFETMAVLGQQRCLDRLDAAQVNMKRGSWS